MAGHASEGQGGSVSGSKVCTRCRVEKSLDQFWFDRRLQRHVAACHSCRATARRNYRDLNRDALRQNSRNWQTRNPERYKANQLRWRQSRRRELAEYTRRWREQNRERALAAQRACDRKLKDAAYAAYGGYRCTCCGETIVPFLSIDHVDNDGAKHRQTIDRRKLYKWLQRNGYPPGFQILCMNCNFGKARNGGVCPHKTSSATSS